MQRPLLASALTIVSFLALVLAPGCAAEDSTAGAQNSGDVLERGSADVAEDVQASLCAEGDPCDDKDPCTHSDICIEGGECQGTSYTCESDHGCFETACAGDGTCNEQLKDGKCWIRDQCYEDGQTSGPGDYCFVCSPGLNTADFSINFGGGCTDEAPCTTDDSCQENGDCEGAPRTCDDNNGCTYDSCDPNPNAATGYPFTCLNDPVNVPCDDGDACTIGDFCAQGACEAEQTLICEDDGDVCTVEICDVETGCSQAPLDCDDDNDCTTDSCANAQGGCVYEDLPDGDACDDHDKCTQTDTCQGGACAGADPLDCGEGEVCTESFCDPKAGCSLLFTEDACDDGFTCTINDICSGTICAGSKESCPSCDDNVFNADAIRVNTFAIPEGGNPGSGLDLDDNPETCAPADNCSEGVDNAMGPLGALINPSLQNALDNGEMNYLVEWVDLESIGTPFTLRIYVGATNTNPDCDDGVCEYYATWDNFTPDCQVRMEFNNAIIDEDGNLTAGGDGSLFVVKGKISGVDITFVIFNSEVVAKLELSTAEDGKPVVENLILGLVGGAVPKALLKDTLDQTLLSGTLKNILFNYLDNEIVEDLDLDGNGTPDASSVSVRFTGVKAKLMGVY